MTPDAGVDFSRLIVGESVVGAFSAVESGRPDNLFLPVEIIAVEVDDNSIVVVVGDFDVTDTVLTVNVVEGVVRFTFLVNTYLFIMIELQLRLHDSSQS